MVREIVYLILGRGSYDRRRKMKFFSFISDVKKWMTFLTLLGVFGGGLVGTVSAQKIRSQVRLMLERLPLEKQQRLKDFAEDIETYINDSDWTGEHSDEEIPVTIQIFLMDKSVSYEDRYSGTFVITNNMDLQYYDKYWVFPYQPGDQLFHSENEFHPFTGCLDFYICLIIGGEYDKYGRFMGTPYFEKAKNISNQAKFNSLYILGWQERSILIDKILSEEYKTFRTMKDLFFLGLSYVGEEDTTAQKYCGQALSLLDKIITEDPEDEEALHFLQAHHMEYIDIFKDKKEVLETLLRLDPENADTYRRHIEE